MTWCFDWVAYQVNGKKDTNRNSAATLRALLRKRGYTPVLRVKAKIASGHAAEPRPQDIGLAITRIASPGPELDTKLKPDDVLIFDDFHTGIVRNSGGSFNHFLQIPGKTGTAYTPQDAKQTENYFVGPEKSWTLQQFFAFSREQPPSHSNEFEWKTWREWLGRRVFGAPRQYPFLHATAEVWRRTTTPPPATGRTATKLRLTLRGPQGAAWAERDLRNLAVKTMPADPTVTAKLGTSVTGTAQLFDGSLAAGEILFVYASHKTPDSAELVVLCSGKGSCSFTMPANPPGRAAREEAVAYICVGIPPKSNLGQGCLHQFDLRVDVLWNE
jgi:hypothetical protein